MVLPENPFSLQFLSWDISHYSTAEAAGVDRILSRVPAQDVEALCDSFRDCTRCVFSPLQAWSNQLSRNFAAKLSHVIDLHDFAFPTTFSIFLPLETYSFLLR